MVAIRWVVAAGCVAMAGMAQAATWRQASSADNSVFFVDLDTVRRNGDTITFVTMSVFDGVTESRDFDTSLIRREARCAAPSSMIAEGHYYREGKLLEHATQPGQMIVHAPNSVMAGVMGTVCGDRAYQTGVIADPAARARTVFAAKKRAGQ